MIIVIISAFYRKGIYHLEQVERCPQVSNTTAASASRHILHVLSSRRRPTSRSSSLTLSRAEAAMAASSSPSEVGGGDGGGF